MRGLIVVLSSAPKQPRFRIAVSCKAEQGCAVLSGVARKVFGFWAGGVWIEVEEKNYCNV